MCYAYFITTKILSKQVIWRKKIVPKKLDIILKTHIWQIHLLFYRKEELTILPSYDAINWLLITLVIV